MLKIEIVGGSLLIAALAVTSPAHAHFKLLMPDPWIVEDDQGGPQKGGPCGPGGYDDVPSVMMTDKVATFHAGDMVPIEWTITVPHTGFFQVSVAKDRADLKDPKLGEDSFCNYSTPPSDTSYPVIATNIDSGATSTMVKLPDDLTCDKCTLQVIMWMTNHPPGCIYYHCADIKVLPKGQSEGTGGMGGSAGTSGGGSGGAAATGTGGMSSGMAGAGGMGMMMRPGTSTGAGGSAAPSGAGGTPATTGTTTGAGGAAPTGGSGGAPAVTGMTAGPTTMTPTGSSKSSGCSVAEPRGGAASMLAVIAAAIGLVGIARRKRSRRN